MKSKNKVAIVLVNYKAYANGYLQDAYNSLINQNYPKNLFSLFIADNSTSKESQEIIAKLAPTATIIKNNENLGWAGGNNSAIKEILKNDFKYILLANMDMVFEKNWLRELVEYAENTNFGIVQSKIVIHDKAKINSLGNRIHYLGFGYCNCYGKDASCSLEKEHCLVDYASGASMLVNREVFEKIGLFREEFFMYHDDLEFGWRARLAGFSVGVAEKSICYHKYNFEGTMNLIYYMERNRLVTLFALERISTLLLILPILIPFELMMLIYMSSLGNFNAKLRAITFPLSPTGIKLISKIRKEVKEYRVVDDRKIVKNFSAKLEFLEIKNPILDHIANPILGLYWKIVRNFII